MSNEILCPNCNALNAVGSKFCNNCGNRLPPSNTIVCPHCQSTNPRDRFYCDNCGKRLVEDTLPKDESRPEQKGSPQRFSLPERDPDQPPTLDPSRLPDWLQTGELRELAERRAQAFEEGDDELPSSIEELAPLKKTTDELPAWLVDDVTSSNPGFDPPKEITTDHFLELLQATDEKTPEVPDDMAKAASEADLPDWLSDVVPGPGSPPETDEATDAAPTESPKSGGPEFELDEKDNVANWGQETDEEEPDWLAELGSPQTGSLDDAEPSSSVLRTSEFAEPVLGGEELPDWLNELGPAQTTGLEDEAPQADETPVSMIFQSAEFADEVKETLGESEIPDWLLEMQPTETETGEEKEADDDQQASPPKEWMTRLAPIPDIEAADEEFEALLADDAAAAAEDAELPDWLSGLGADDLDEPDPTAESTSFFLAHSPDSRPFDQEQEVADEPEAADQFDDWLNEIEAAADDDAPPDSGEIGDWLADLEETPGTETEAAASDLTDIGDWLDELEDTPSTAESAAPGQKEESDESPIDDDLLAMFADEEPASDVSDDWLAELGPAEATTLDESAAAASKEEDDLFEDLSDVTGDWLAELGPAETVALDDESGALADLLGDTGEQDDDAIGTSGELPGWLSELGPVQTNILTPTPTDEETPAPVDADEGISADLSDIFSIGSGADDILPDWLRADDDEPEETTAVSDADADFPAAADVDAEPAEDEIPDEFEELFASEFETETEAVEEEPDWLAEITALGPEALTSDLGDGDESIPEWSTDEQAVLDDIFDMAAAEATGDEVVDDFLPPSDPADDFVSVSDEPAEEEEFDADFGPLFSFDKTEETVPEAVDAADEEEDSLQFESEDTDEMPEWLTQLGPPSATDTPPAAETETGDEDLVVEELPEWLSQMKPDEDEKASSLSGLSKSQTLIDEPFDTIPDELIGADLPDWLEGVTQTSFDEDGQDEDGLGALDDLPEWLREGMDDVFDDEEMLPISTQLSEMLEELPPSRDLADDLAKADIPDWVQAMKPRELTSEGPEPEPERPLQESGPLSGIRGVIDIEPVVAATYAGTIPFNEFTVTKEQQQQATLLRQLSYATQEEETGLQPVGAVTASTVTRLVLALLLLATIVVGLLGPSVIRSEMTAPSPPLAAVNTAVSAAAGQPVLVAFEYTPAFSAELSPQVEVLLAQLAANDSPVIPVTQYAASVGLAAEMEQSFLIPEPFLIPGEAIGLRELSACLQVPCNTIAGHPLNNYDDVNLRQLLNDTALIIVFTGERDSLVNWIEQVGLPNSETPLLVGVPQALAPVTNPYTFSNQITGAIAGLGDLAQYQEAFEVETDTDFSRILNAQQLAQLLVVVLLLGGGIMSIMARPLTRRRQQKIQAPDE